MVSQTEQLKTDNGRLKSSSRGMGGSVRELIHDAIVLGELQVKLLLLDLREGRNGVIGPIVVMTLALCMALGCFPILLATLGLGLAAAGLPYWGAFLIAAGVGLLVSAAAAYGGWRWLRSELSIFKRSQSELQNNIHGLKNAMKH